MLTLQIQYSRLHKTTHFHMLSSQLTLYTLVQMYTPTGINGCTVNKTGPL